MKIEYRISREEYLEAIRVNARVKGKRDWSRYVGYATVSLGLLVLASGGPGLRLVAPVALMALGLWIIVRPVWQAYSEIEKKWREYDEAKMFVSLEADEDWLRIRGPAWQVEWQWVTFGRFVESASLLMLYKHDGELAASIPKRSFATPEELSEFRELLKRQLNEPRSTGGFPVVR
jgi:hypothetical protein